jgi:hypothetical protein
MTLRMDTAPRQGSRSAHIPCTPWRNPGPIFKRGQRRRSGRRRSCVCSLRHRHLPCTDTSPRRCQLADQQRNCGGMSRNDDDAVGAPPAAQRRGGEERRA